MKKLITIILLIFIAACLSSCGKGLDETNYTGLWQHKDYPDNYSLIVYEDDNGCISFFAEALQGNGFRIAQSNIEQVDIKNGEGMFEFLDNFSNMGKGTVSIKGEELNLNYERMTYYLGGWCVDTGAGIYVKTKELSEIEDFDISNYKNSDNSNIDIKEKEVEPTKYLWYAKYIKVINDEVFDEDIAFGFTDGKGFTIDNYQEKKNNYSTTYEQDEIGTYQVFDSDYSGYDFRLLASMEDGSQKMWYGKSIVGKDLIEFYYYNEDTSAIHFFGKYATQGYAYDTYGFDSEYKRVYGEKD